MKRKHSQNLKKELQEWTEKARQQHPERENADIESLIIDLAFEVAQGFEYRARRAANEGRNFVDVVTPQNLTPSNLQVFDMIVEQLKKHSVFSCFKVERHVDSFVVSARVSW